MKRTFITASLALIGLVAFAAIENDANAQSPEASALSIADLVGGTVTVTTNPHGRGPMIIEGVLLGSDVNGILLQTSKTRTWVPVQAVLMVESP